MEEITRDMKMSEVLEKNPEAAKKLFEMGLFCGGCAFSQFETIEEGARAHGIDVDELLKEINDTKQDKN